MKSSVRVFALFAAICLSSSLASAQTTRQSTVQRAPARATLVQQNPDLSAALRDSAVQAELNRTVRGVNLRSEAQAMSRARIDTSGFVADSDQPIQPRRLMSTGQLNALQAPPSDAGRATAMVLDRAISRLGNSTGRIENIAPPPRTARLSPSAPSGVGNIAAPPTPYLDVNGFGEDLHAALQNSVNGYAMRMRRNGQTIYTLQWNWAQTPNDGSLGWSPGRRMHVASISKFITAMALTHALDANNIDYDDPIGPWLPTYWSPGANVNSIRFSDLMNHLSGFGTGGSDGSFSTIRGQVQGGVPGNEIGNWNTADYENMNFALCRILIATITGSINRNANFGSFNDTIWNAVTIAAYRDYVRDNVFAPSGINPNGPQLSKPNAPAMAYLQNGGSGWSSGDLTNQAGGVAWHISIDELLNVVGEFRRGGGIVSPMRALEVLNASYGLNSPVNGEGSPAGRFYYKPGLWQNGNNQTEQALVMLLPENIEVAIFVNSPIGVNDASLQTLGRTLYTNNIVEP